VALRAAETGPSAVCVAGLLAVALAVVENPKVPVVFPAVASMALALWLGLRLCSCFRQVGGYFPRLGCSGQDQPSAHEVHLPAKTIDTASGTASRPPAEAAEPTSRWFPALALGVANQSNLAPP
jgi:hypothetical protein